MHQRDEAQLRPPLAGLAPALDRREQIRYVRADRALGVAAPGLAPGQPSSITGSSRERPLELGLRDEAGDRATLGRHRPAALVDRSADPIGRPGAPGPRAPRRPPSPTATKWARSSSTPGLVVHEHEVQVGVGPAGPLLLERAARGGLHRPRDASRGRARGACSSAASASARLRPGAGLAAVARPDAERSRARAEERRARRRRSGRSRVSRWRVEAWYMRRVSLRMGSERRRAAPRGGPYERNGGDLLSQGREAQVPSALRGLTALFGMGRGVAPSLSPPKVVRAPSPRRSLKTAQHGLPPASRSARRATERSKYPSSPRTISTGLLSALLRLHIRPITWWSSRGLTPSRGWESSSRGRLPA